MMTTMQRFPWTLAVASVVVLAKTTGVVAGQAIVGFKHTPGERFRLRFGVLLHVAPAGEKMDLSAAYADYLRLIRRLPRAEEVRQGAQRESY